jgi:hypothetical protein
MRGYPASWVQIYSLNQCSTRNVRDQVSHPYKITYQTSVFNLIPSFLKYKTRLMRSLFSLCVYVSPYFLSLPSVCMCILLPLLGNSYEKTLLPQRIHT